MTLRGRGDDGGRGGQGEIAARLSGDAGALGGPCPDEPGPNCFTIYADLLRDTADTLDDAGEVDCDVWDLLDLAS